MASSENARLVEKLRQAPAISGATLEEQRRNFEAQLSGLPVADGVQIVPTEGVDGEWFRVGGASTAALLFLHGGGFVIGSSRSHRSLISNIGAECGIDALALNYRLAPEHPCPAAVDDTLAAYRLLLSTGRLPQQIAFVSDSGGGAIAIAALIGIRDAGLPLPACVACMSAWLDLTLTNDSLQRNAVHDPLLKIDQLRGMASAYLNGLAPSDPRASPGFGNLAGLPPILLQTGTWDVLEDDSTVFVALARRAGVDATADVWPDMIHNWHFHAHALPEGREAIARLGQFVKRHVGI